MAKRTAVEQKAANAEKQRLYRARQKAKSSPSSISSGVPDNGGTVEPLDGLEIDVIAEDQPVEPKLSLFERTMNKIGLVSQDAPAKKSRGRAKKPSENLLVTALPTVLASLVVTYANSLLPEEYAACAPQQEEVTGIISPLMEIIGRRVEIAGKVNQDATDIISSILCAFMMGVRMYVTFVEIRNENNPHGTKQHPPRRTQQRYEDYYEEELTSDSPGENSNGVSLATGMRSHQSKSQGIGSNDIGDHGGAIYAHDAKNDVERNGADASTHPGQSPDSEAAKVANLFKRDITGRQQLGLLPMRV